MPFLRFLHAVAAGENLSPADARAAMQAILEGSASPVQAGAFLAALRVKGETADELFGFAQAMRDAARPIDTGASTAPLLDTCGTGGDGPSTFNISTVAAFVVAGAGVRVAKHGNRSISSQCGSADLMEALGVRISLTPEDVGRAIREVGIGFLFAPAFHVAMKNVQPVRLELKMRTVFNLLGPLTNPAGATAQLVGAPSERAAELIAGALAALGLPRGFVVHGVDGLDEVTTTGATLVFSIDRGRVDRCVYQPEDFGISRADPAALAGGDPERNKEIALQILTGVTGPQRDIVLVNSAMALLAAGQGTGPAAAMEIARESIDSGRALAKLQQLIEFR